MQRAGVGTVQGMSDKSASKPAPKPQADWEAIELAFRAGVLTLRQICDKHGGSPAGVLKRAKKFDWSRDLNAKIQAKADELVNKLAVNTEVNTGKLFTESQLIVENGAQAAAIRLGHRKVIGRLQTIIAAQLDELEASSGTEQAERLRSLGDLMREPDDFNRDKLNDIYRTVISLPERSKVAKQLAETLRIAIDLERREFGMDKMVTDDPLTALIRRINSGAGSAFKPVAIDPAYSGDDDA